MTSQAASRDSGHGRFAYLDGLRGWAALLVVVDHGTNAIDYALNTGRVADSRGAWDIWLSGTPFLGFAEAGSLAVCIFFALSGFVLTHAYVHSRQYWIALAVRRYVRLGIPMLAGSLLGWAVLWFGLASAQQVAAITHSSWLGSQFGQAPNLLAALLEPVRLLFLQSVPVAVDYDSSLWTMPVEAVGSLLLITAFMVMRRGGNRSETSAGLGFLAVAVVCSGSYLSLFAFGASLRLLQPVRLHRAIGGNRWWVGGMLLGGLFFGTVPANMHGWVLYRLMARIAALVPWPWLWTHSASSFWHGIGAALILLAVYFSPAMQALLSRPSGRFLGRISFPLYVLHLPVLMVVECHLLLLFRAGGVPTVPASLISIAVFVVAAVVVSAALTPAVEGGAIALSARIGRGVNALTGRLMRAAAGEMPAAPTLAARPVGDAEPRRVD